MYHQNFAGNCFENRQEELCRSDGLGPRFDCSGFVIAAICKARGRSVADWNGPRHVRDFWRLAQRGESGIAVTHPVVGSLLVTPRVYDVAGRQPTVPAHMGILVEVSEEKPLRWLHANPQSGKVEECVVVSQSVPLGAISLVGFFAANFLPEYTPCGANLAGDNF